MPADDLTLALRIRADVQQALAGMRNMDRSLGNIDRRGKRADRTMRSMLRTVFRLGAAYLSLRAGLGVVRSIVGATGEQAAALAQVERGLRNLDRQTTLTSASLQKQAADIQSLTTVGDELILRYQSILLTFRQIDESNFNRTIVAALDLSTALDTTAKEAALQLGKALEDPTRGLTALRRSGTVFSEEQETVIKRLVETNRLAEAQSLILAEVERQYGGSAAAARSGFGAVGGAAQALNNTIGDLLENVDGAEDLRVEIEGLNTAFKDPGAQAAVRGFVDAFVSGLAAIASGAADVVAGLGDIYAALSPDAETPGQRVRAFATGEGALTLEDLRRDQRLRKAAEGQLARLRETIAQQEAEIAANEAAIASPVADQRRQQADNANANRQAAEAADLGIGRQLRPEDPTIADQERAELERTRGVLAQRLQSAERLARVLSLVDAGNVPSGFTQPGRLPARFLRPSGPAGPSEEEVKAAEAAAREIEAITAASQDRLADLTLSRIERIDREEALALDRLRELGKTKGVDAAATEAASLATQQAYAAERHQVRVEGLAREHDALVASLEAGVEAREQAAQREAEAAADALAEIERREVDLGIVGEYQAAITAANRWRDATLADLDETGEGYEELRKRVEAVHARMTEAALEAARQQREAGGTLYEGFGAGLRDYEEQVGSVFDRGRRAAESAFRGMEDALVEFVRSGTLDFSSLADSIISDLARIAIQQAITLPLANALFGAFAGPPVSPAGGVAPAVPPGVSLFGGVAHEGGIAGRPGGVRRLVPPAVFAGAGRFHAGGIAGALRPDEVPVIARRGEGIFTPEQMQALGGPPHIEINFENRGTPQREVRREVRFDPGRMVVAIFTDDWQKRGPIRRTIESGAPGGGAA